MGYKYLEPLHECAKILKKTEGVNYIVLCADVDTKAHAFVGGWNFSDGDKDPDFFTMVGGLMENYLEEVGASYTEKLRLIREFNTNLIENITKEGE